MLVGDVSCTPMLDLQRLFGLARDLVAIDTTSGRSLVASHDLIQAHVADAGVTVERLPGSGDDRPSLLLSRGGDGPEGLMLCGHLDTVPPGDGWSGDPLALAEHEGRWYGRGSCDMTVFCALAVELIRGAAVDKPLAVLLLGDEELGALGAAALVDTWPEGRVLPKACVIGEPTSVQVVGSHTGHLKATITVHGETGHTGTPESGHNAIAPIERVLHTIDAIRQRWTGDRTANGELVPVPHPVISLVGLEGGNAWNVIPIKPRCASAFAPCPIKIRATCLMTLWSRFLRRLKANSGDLTSSTIIHRCTRPQRAPRTPGYWTDLAKARHKARLFAVMAAI